MIPATTPAELRLLLRTVTPKDAVLASRILNSAGIDCHACSTGQDLVSEIKNGAGALLIAEEALGDPAMSSLATLLQSQAPWSDLPVIVVASSGSVSTAIIQAMDMPANITVIERPLRVFSLISAARSALRARRRQYEIRGLLEGLREADQRKTEFLATLAHELRNPLAPLSTALAILTFKEHSPEAARPHYEMMKRQVRHMTRLIDDLMEVSRITRGKIELKMEPISLNRVIEEAIDLSHATLEAREHILTRTLPARGFLLRGDSVRLVQVFSNLLNNAAKYTPAGGRIELEASVEGKRARIRVRDNGVGIAADMLDAVFDMFVQVSDTARAAQGGLGIGLTLVKSLVEAHDGRVSAYSAGAGLGTEIVVELPVVGVASGGVLPSGDEKPADRLAENVLIVDDNCDAADSLAILLTALGAKTLVTYDGPTALEMVATNPVSVAILDIGMPGMDGCELATRLRGDQRNGDMILVALTGWGQANDRARITGAGFQYHFLKPLDTDALVASILAQRAAA